MGQLIPALITVLCPGFLAAATWPGPGNIPVCTDYECDDKRQISLSDNHWQTLSALFDQKATAAQERAQIGHYIAQMEQLVGERTETWRDRGRNDPNVPPLGQLDCIAESINTTTYLKLLQSAGLLRWHEVLTRSVRNRWGLQAHWTAVIRERETGANFAVDSWYLDNGEQPIILPLSSWLAGDISPDD